MKNFPDRDQFNELENRLQNYTEQPDDFVWENIDAALRPDRTLFWLPWVDYVASAISIFICVLAIQGDQLDYSSLGSESVNEIKSSIPSKKGNGITLNQNEAEKKRGNTEAAGAPVNSTGTQKILSNFARVKSKNQFNTSHKSEISSELDTAQAMPQTVNEAEVFLAIRLADSLQMPSVRLSADSITQNKNEVKQSKRLPKKARPSVFVNVTPSLSFQHAVPLDNDDVIVNEFSEVSILSMERFGISLDLGMQGFISKRFEYYGGLSFYHQNQILKYSYQTGDQVSVESSGENNYTVTPKSFVGSIRYEMLNIGVHGGILYNLYGKALTHKIGVGVSYQNGFKKSKSEEYENSESSYFSYQVFYRNEVRVSPRLRFFVQPVFTQSIRVRERLDAPFNLKPYRAGIGLGILYDF